VGTCDREQLVTTPRPSAWRVPFNRPYSGRRLLELVKTVAESTHHSGDGPIGLACQQRLGEIQGGASVVLTPSCTHALELAALTLDLGPQDEVIVPAFTFTSTATAFALRGATLRFADVDPLTLGITAESVKQRVSDRTRAIVPMHYAGIACDMPAVCDVADQHGASIVEDNAHGLFAALDGRQLGSFGRLSALSFHETKNISCGEGGALVVNDESLLDRVFVAREKGTNRHAFFRGAVDKYTWIGLGSSWLPSEFTSAVLLAALEDASITQSRRHVVWTNYRRALSDWSHEHGVQLPHVSGGAEQPAHLFHLVFSRSDQRTAFIEHMAAAGVQAVFHYQPLHLTDAAQRFGIPEACPVTESVATRLVRVPLHANLTDTEVELVVETALTFKP
jgi:dTDP-4-amino-4,6-dideoxygalactose transaminase